MNTTKLSTLLNRMDRWQTVVSGEEQYKVKDLDFSIRQLERTIKCPWDLMKSTIRIFPAVDEYPIAADHDQLAFIVNDKVYANQPKFNYTSVKQFKENYNDKNYIAEIYINGDKFLGIKYNSLNNEKSTLSDAQSKSYYSYTGDITAIDEDIVITKIGDRSIKVTVVNSVGSATLTNTLPSTLSDSNYKRKYHFRWIYLDSAPTSIQMRLKTDASNYLYKDLTTQYSGRAFEADAWNLIGYELSNASQTGTFNENSITGEDIGLTGASSGTYYVSESSLQGWELMDYWYYSKYHVKSSGSSVRNQRYFYNDTTENYSTDEELICDDEYADVVMFDALLMNINEKENSKLASSIQGLRDNAWVALLTNHPDLVPLVATDGYEFVGSSDINQK